MTNIYQPNEEEEPLESNERAKAAEDSSINSSRCLPLQRNSFTVVMSSFIRYCFLLDFSRFTHPSTNELNTMQRKLDKNLEIILKHLQNTQMFQEKMGAESIDIKTFRKIVPLSTYDSHDELYSKHIRRMVSDASDMENVMFPGSPDFFIRTGGTTGPRKYFPTHSKIPTGISNGGFRHYLGVLLKASQGEILLKLPYANIPKMSLIGRTIDCVTPSGLPVGFGISKIPHDNGQIVPEIITKIHSFDLFISLHAIWSLNRPDLRMIAFAFPNALMSFFHTIDKHWDLIVQVIRSGNLPSLKEINLLWGENIISLAEWEEIQRLFPPPNPGRADFLSSLKFSENRMHKVWPNLWIIMGVFTGRYSTLIPRFQEIMRGSNVMFWNCIYSSSEGYFGTGANETDNDFVLDGSPYMEFLPISMAADKSVTSSALIPMSQLKIGEVYELVHTNGRGLYRYRQGDILQMLGWTKIGRSFGEIRPRMAFLGREGQALGISGERMSEFDILLSLGDLEIPFLEVSVTEHVDAYKPSYLFFLEFSSDYTEKIINSENLAPCLSLWREKLQKSLISRHSDYAFRVTNFRIDPPIVLMVKPGTHETIFRARLADSIGSDGVELFSQLKTNIVIRDSKLLKILRDASF